MEEEKKVIGKEEEEKPIKKKEEKGAVKKEEVGTISVTKKLNLRLFPRNWSDLTDEQYRDLKSGKSVSVKKKVFEKFRDYLKKS